MEKLRINTKVYTLDEVYSNLNHGNIFSRLLALKEIQDELEEQLNILVASYNTLNMTTKKDVLQLIEGIETQLYYLDLNIVVFENALLCHETKVYEVRNILGGNTKIWLN